MWRRIHKDLGKDNCGTNSIWLHLHYVIMGHGSLPQGIVGWHYLLSLERDGSVYKEIRKEALNLSLAFREFNQLLSWLILPGHFTQLRIFLSKTDYPKSWCCVDCADDEICIMRSVRSPCLLKYTFRFSFLESLNTMLMFLVRASKQKNTPGNTKD